MKVENYIIIHNTFEDLKESIEVSLLSFNLDCEDKLLIRDKIVADVKNWMVSFFDDLTLK